MPRFEFLNRPTRDQTEGILRLYRNEGWWGEGPDDPDLVRRMVAGSHCFLLVTADGRDPAVIAMGRALSDGAGDAYIQDVAVAPPWRGRGVGAGIIRRLADRLHRDGLYWIGLIAERGSDPFYRRLGFETMPDALPMRLKNRS